MNTAYVRMQHALGRMHTGWLFTGIVLYFFSMVLLSPTPWLPSAPGFSFGSSLIWASVPIVLGLLSSRPSLITAGFLLASLTPYNQTTVILGFLLGCFLGLKTLYQYRRNYRELLTVVFVRKGFYILLGLTAYLAVVWLIRLGDSTDGWSFLALASTFLTVPFAVYSLAYLPWTHEEIQHTIRMLVLTGAALIVVAVLYPLLCGRYEQYTQAAFVFYKSLRVIVDIPLTMQWVDPDYNRVSFSSSHYFAAWMLIFAVGAAVLMLHSKRKALYAFLAIGGIYCFALGENAHILPGAFAGLIAVGLLFAWRKFPNVSASVAAASVMIVAIGTTAVLLGTLYFNGGRYSLSQKAALYESAVTRIVSHPGRMLLGDGPSAFASRAANKRLPDEKMEIEYSFPFAVPDYASPDFYRAVKQAGVHEGGSTMKNPFTGIAGIVIEWGILGSIILILVCFVLVRSSIRVLRSAANPTMRILSITGIFGLVMLSVSLAVRTYYEYTELTVLVAVLIMLAVSSASLRDTAAAERLVE